MPLCDPWFSITFLEMLACSTLSQVRCWGPAALNPAQTPRSTETPQPRASTLNPYSTRTGTPKRTLKATLKTNFKGTMASQPSTGANSSFQWRESSETSMKLDSGSSQLLLWLKFSKFCGGGGGVWMDLGSDGVVSGAEGKHMVHPKPLNP